jgi:hypothetical protein
MQTHKDPDQLDLVESLAIFTSLTTLFVAVVVLVFVV